MSRKLKSIMKEKPDKRETALRRYAQELGCSLSSTYTSEGKHLEEEVVRRIQESIRETRMWWIALISAVASVFSALAAWFAVMR
jgi:hypothetical protein